jgi:uncharacterized protein (TIGR00645 family)
MAIHNEIHKLKIIRIVEEIIFNAKWILVLFYLGLISVMCVYTYTYAEELIRLLRFTSVQNADTMMLKILEIVDIVMVANLVKMILTGSYNSFISKEHGYPNENLSSGTLKIKMSTSMVGVSSIHLLRSFIDAENIGWPEVGKQLSIHGILLVGAFTLVVIEYFHTKIERMEHDDEKATV